MENINGEGSFDLKMEFKNVFTIRTTKPFTLLVNGDIVAPCASTDRIAQVTVQAGDMVTVDTDGRYTYRLKGLPPRGEVVSGESLVEVVPEDSLSMYDRLKAEMLGHISRFADEKGLDTFEDADDFDMDDDDDPLIDTPHEYMVMREEYLRDNADSENFSRASPEQGEAQDKRSASEIAEKEPESPTISETA